MTSKPYEYPHSLSTVGFFVEAVNMAAKADCRHRASSPVVDERPVLPRSFASSALTRHAAVITLAVLAGTTFLMFVA